jgi:hypothetical protein
VKPRGGLKLAVRGAGHDDRRVRYAAVSISTTGDREDTTLVTDSQGRLRYPLEPGEYRLRLDFGDEARFAVRDQRWTSVRVQLR